jgi:hypothetical protein
MKKTEKQIGGWKQYAIMFVLFLLITLLDISF